MRGTVATWRGGDAKELGADCIPGREQTGIATPLFARVPVCSFTTNMVIHSDPYPHLCRQAAKVRAEIFRRPSIGLEAKLRLFMLNIGFRRPMELKKLALELSRESVEVLGLDPKRGLFDADGLIRDDVLQSLRIRKSDYYFQVRHDEDRRLLRDASHNDYFDPDYPGEKYQVRASVRRLATLERRREMEMLSCLGGVLLADNAWYQAFSADTEAFYPSGSPLALGKAALHCPENLVSGDIVSIGDIFSGRNICHFTLCWLNRVAMFCVAEPSRVSAATFIGPAATSPYVALMLEGMRRAYGVRSDQFVFPDSLARYRAEGSLFWFSDSGKKPNSHPAHFFHPESVEHLRRFGAGVRAAADFTGEASRKVYISRADAPTRRLANEDVVWPMLEGKGFRRVELAKMTPADQVNAIASADVVVSPHGAGLTHLAFTERQPRVIELHNPVSGSDAYRGLARALGHDYRWLIGSPAGDFAAFTVDPDALAEEVDR